MSAILGIAGFSAMLGAGALWLATSGREPGRNASGVSVQRIAAGIFLLGFLMCAAAVLLKDVLADLVQGLH